MCLPFKNLSERTLEQGVHAGFLYEIVHNGIGYRCGYVRVLPGHPWFGKGYDDVDVAVHGGLTFAAAGQACPTHDEDAEWWLGFDCGHSGDARDPALPYPETVREVDRLYPMPEGYETIKTQDYVRAECLSLAEQAVKAIMGE